MKVCSFCKISKMESEFHKKTASSDGLRDKCKDCAKAYIRKHYRDNKQYYVDKATEGAKRSRNRISKIKDTPCMDCGLRFPPECMDFDHVRGEKKFNVSQMARLNSEERTSKEIEKCDIVCANCHRIRTTKRLRARSVANSAALS